MPRMAEFFKAAGSASLPSRVSRPKEAAAMPNESALAEAYGLRQMFPLHTKASLSTAAHSMACELW